jgi:hypothetical protein
LWFWGTVGGDYPVYTKIIVVGFIAKIAAIGKKCFPVVILFQNSLVDPVPNKAANKLRIFMH